MPPRYEDGSESIFQGFYVVTEEGLSKRRLDHLINESLGEGWTHRLLTGEHHTEYEIIHTEILFSPDEAWDKAFELNMFGEIEDAEPIFQLVMDEGKFETRKNSGTIPFMGKIPIVNQVESFLKRNKSTPVIPTNNSRWVIKFLGVEDAWRKHFLDKGKIPGQGVKIAQPDTGYTLHPAIHGKLSLDEGYDFVDEDHDQHDPMDNPPDEVVKNPGHGTLAASVIVAKIPEGKDDVEDDFVVGISPGSKLIPLRVTSSVLIFNTRNLSRAIDYATEKRFHVISMSLGCALHSKILKRSIENANKQGVILVAAAGTFTPIVVYPAAYDDVIGVGGCTATREMWKGSPRGSAIDVTAPSEEVYIARTKRMGGKTDFSIEKGTGTSLSTPIVAGVAALWLSHHGWDNLADRYGKHNIPVLFKKLLCETCDRPQHWDTSIQGAGIVNADKLLAAPLPKHVPKMNTAQLKQKGRRFGLF